MSARKRRAGKAALVAAGAMDELQLARARIDTHRELSRLQSSYNAIVREIERRAANKRKLAKSIRKGDTYGHAETSDAHPET